MALFLSLVPKKVSAASWPGRIYNITKKQYQTVGPKFFSSNRTVITMSTNDPFSDLKTDSGSSRRDLAFSGLKTATLDFQVLFFVRKLLPQTHRPIDPQTTNKAERQRNVIIE